MQSTTKTDGPQQRDAERALESIREKCAARLAALESMYKTLAELRKIWAAI